MTTVHAGMLLADRYELIEPIGEGAMGVVWRAKHALMRNNLAIKLLQGHAREDPRLTSRFLREAQASSNIDHPNICGATDFGETSDGLLYLAMEYLEGVTLKRRLRKTRLLPIGRVVLIAAQICGALEAAHQLGIVHRDLKPDNIFLIDRQGYPDFVKILDFGLARVYLEDGAGKSLTGAGEIFGTPRYMAPEQAEGHRVDHRADLYSLGCILYEMLAGSPPFDAVNPMQLLWKHVMKTPESPSSRRPESAPLIPLALEEMTLKLLEKEPDARPDSAAALVAQLEALDLSAHGDVRGAFEHLSRGSVSGSFTKGAMTGLAPLFDEVDSEANASGDIALDDTSSPGNLGVKLTALSRVGEIDGGDATSNDLLRSRDASVSGGSLALKSPPNTAGRRGLMIGGGVAVLFVGIVVWVLVQGASDEGDGTARTTPGSDGGGASTVDIAGGEIVANPEDVIAAKDTIVSAAVDVAAVDVAAVDVAAPDTAEETAPDTIASTDTSAAALAAADVTVDVATGAASSEETMDTSAPPTPEVELPAMLSPRIKASEQPLDVAILDLVREDERVRAALFELEQEDRATQGLAALRKRERAHRKSAAFNALLGRSHGMGGADADAVAAYTKLIEGKPEALESYFVIDTLTMLVSRRRHKTAEPARALVTRYIEGAPVLRSEVVELAIYSPFLATRYAARHILIDAGLWSTLERWQQLAMKLRGVAKGKCSELRPPLTALIALEDPRAQPALNAFHDDALTGCGRRKEHPCCPKLLPELKAALGR